MKRLTILALLLMANLAYSQGTSISNLPEITAADVDDDTEILFGVSDTGGDPIVSRKMTLRELRKTGDVINVRDYGAISGDATDDTAAIQAALTASDLSGLPVLSQGTFDVDSALSATNLKLRGPAVFNCDATITVSGSIDVEDVVFDGNETATTLVTKTASTDDVSFRRCTFRDVYHADGVASAFTCGGAGTVTFDECLIEDITALTNSVVADLIGNALGVFCQGTIDRITITRTKFKDINTVDSLNGANLIEVANAIHTDDNSGAVPRLTIVDQCVFENVGKRAVKANSTESDYRTEFRNSRIVSGWTSVTDNDPGMTNAIEIQGGDAHVENCELTGDGAALAFFRVGTGAKNVVVKNVRHTPLARNTIDGSSTSFCRLIASSTSTDVSIENCHCDDAYWAIFTSACHSITVKDSTLKAANHVYRQQDASTRIIRLLNNQISLATNLADASGDAVQLNNGNELVEIHGNYIDGCAVGINMSVAQTGDDWRLLVTGNRFVNVADIYEKGSHSIPPNVLISGNYPAGEEVASVTFTDEDATPSVEAYGARFVTANTMATTITDFDDGVDGQLIAITVGDAFTTIADDDTNIELSGDGNFAPAGAATITLENRGGTWYEVSRTVY